MRYSGQSYAVEVSSPRLDDPDTLGRDFRRLHETLFGFATNEPWELTSLRLRIAVPRDNRLGDMAGPENRPAAPTKTRLAWFDAHDPVPTPRFDRDRLAEGQVVDGPAVIEDQSSTVVVPPGATLVSDARGHLHMDAGGTA